LYVLGFQDTKADTGTGSEDGNKRKVRYWQGNPVANRLTMKVVSGFDSLTFRAIAGTTHLDD